MTIQELLNDFVAFTKYDPDQKRFNLNSDEYLFHKAGKDIERLLSGFDPSGALSTMRARTVFMQVTQNIRIPLYDWLANPQVSEEMSVYADMWKKLNDPEILKAEDAYLNSLNEIVQHTMGISMIGDRDIEQERETFLNSAMQVINDLEKIKFDCYQSSSVPVGTIQKFCTRILVFDRMADCILHISQGPDAIYLCYISQNQSADGYFAFLLKSNGNLVAFHDRIDEAYIGQHKYLRNGRWTDAHMDQLFPYNYIFHFENYDYKGYAGTYVIDSEKLDFIRLGSEVYQPLLVAMLILKNKYEGKVFDTSNQMLLNTFMQQNFLEEHRNLNETELAVIEKNEVAIRSNQYVCSLDPKKIVTESGYNKEFGLYDHTIPWVELYGSGFVPDFPAALRSCNRSIREQDGESSNTIPMIEFIGNQDRMDKQVYYEIRKQLADYIKKQMQEELDSFGTDKAIEYWLLKAKEKKERFIDLICKKTYQKSHPEIDWGKDAECLTSIEASDSFNRNEKRIYNNRCFKNHWHGNLIDGMFDDYNGAKCSIYYQLNPQNWLMMESFLEEPLPRIFCGFGQDDYNGNSNLSVTDPVGDLTCPFSEYRFNLYMTIGFSKNGWKQTYSTWLKEHGYEDELIRLKEKRKVDIQKQLEAQKHELACVQPYDHDNRFDEYENKEALIRAERDVDQIFPGKRFSTFYMDPTNESQKRYVTSVTINVPVKGNTKKIQQLLDLGWEKEEARVSAGKKIQRLKYSFKRVDCMK